MKKYLILCLLFLALVLVISVNLCTAQCTSPTVGTISGSTSVPLGGSITLTYSPPTLAIGSTYGGGKLAYLLSPGDPGYINGINKGFIAAPTDQSTGAVWGTYGAYLGDTSTALGAGHINSSAISLAYGAGTAAYVCENLTLGGYSDWYLPSLIELNKLYANKSLIGGFSNADYWTSSERDNYLAWAQYFATGALSTGASKNQPRYVRAIRSFTDSGSWSSSDITIATVNSAGVVSGVSSGTTVITYTVNNGCASSLVTYSLTVTDTTTCPQVITTVAGTGTAGYSGDGGAATSATFTSTSDIVLDNAGNMYIADAGNNRIRKVNSSGIISTIAGNGVAGFSGDGGPATAASFNNPNTIALDAAGNIFVNDGSNRRIRKITTAGIISTVAGNGSIGFSGDGGAATAASIYNPTGVAVDATGNLYIADLNNNRIRKVNTSGIISTIAGNGGFGYSGDGGSAISATLADPTRPTVDAAGNVFFADVSNNRIRKITPAGIISTVAGNGTAGFSGDGAAATTASLAYPRSVTVDNLGNLYITDFNNNRIRKVNTTGIITTIAGTGSVGYSGDGGAATAATLNYPTQLAVDASGAIYIADLNNNCIRKISNGVIVANIIGASSICAGNTTLYTDSTSGGIWSSSNSSIATVDASGNVTGLSVGSAIISYVVTNSCGTATAIKSITVNAMPTVTASAGSSAICIGQATTLTSGGASTYSWSPVVGLSATTGSSTTFNGSSTATYTVTGTNTVTGCSSTATVTISVNPLPTVAATAGSSNICLGNSTTLTATGATTYSWLPSASLSATTGSTVTATPASTTTYTVVGTASGCSNSSTVTVAINTTPTITATAGSSAICSGNSTTISASGGTTYIWSPSAGLSATTGATVTATPTVTTTYTITGTNGSGCTNTTTKTITVNSLPTVILASGTTTLCAGNSTTISATGAATYTWTPGSGLSATTGTTVTATPLFTTTYTVTGTNGSGCANTTTKTITVNPLPTVTASSGISVLCLGNTTTISATGATTYTWVPATGLSATTGIMVTTTPTATTTYTVTGTNSNGCINTATATITVNTLPTIIATSGSPAICIGNSTTISASGGVSYTWTPGTGLSTTTGGIVTANPATTTNYTITGTNGSGCSNTATKTITVNPLPTVIATAGVSALCIGNSTTISVTGATTYTWAPATGLNATTGANVTATPTVTTTYTVTGINVNGCTNTSITTTTVNALPSIIATPGMSSVCIGNSTTISASGAATYTWTPASGLSGTTGSIVSVTPTSTTTYTVTGTNSNGCINIGIATVTVSATPTITATASLSPICAGNSTVISAVGATTYTWTPTVGLTTSVGSSVVATPVSTTTYTVTGSSGAGCTGSNTITVIVNPLPAAGTITGSSSVCASNSTTLTASLSGGIWSVSNGNAIITAPGVVMGINAGIDTILYTLTNTCGTGVATYPISVSVCTTGSNITGLTRVCKGRNTLFTTTIPYAGTWSSSNTYVATINPTTGMLTANNVGSTIVKYRFFNGTNYDSSMMGVLVLALPTPTIGLTYGNALYTGSYTTYQWYKNGVAISGATSSLYVYTSSGSYTVKVTNGAGCTSTSAPYVVPHTTSITGQNVANTITVSPNPTTGIVNINYDEDCESIVTDLAGRVLKTTKEKQFDLSDYAPGMYILRIVDPEGAILSITKITKL